jgi:hypothetical protein
MAKKKQETSSDLEIAITSTKFDICESKEHLAEQETKLEALRKKLIVAQRLEREAGKNPIIAKEQGKSMSLCYTHSEKIYRCRRSFDLYPFIYDFRMELYGTVVANIAIVVRDKYLKEGQFSNLRITNISPELSPEGVFKAAIIDYFNNHKQSKNTQEQIEGVFKALDVYICRNEDPEYDYMPREEITLGDMKYVFRSKQTMPGPGEEAFGAEGRLEITNLKTGYKSSAAEPIESFEAFIRKYLTGITFEVKNETKFLNSNAARVLTKHNMDAVKREGSENIYKVIRRK